MPQHTNNYPKLHNAMWPGLVGKEPGTDHPPISLDRMLELTAGAEVNGQKFDGIDYLVFHAYDAKDEGKPKLKISKIEWDSNGWPVCKLP